MKRKLIAFLLSLTLIMIIASLKGLHGKGFHGVPGFFAAFGVLGAIFFLLASKALSYINQRKGFDD